MSTMLRGSANGGGRGPPDRRPKPGPSKAGSATDQRRGRKRRRQSLPLSQRSATPSCDGRGGRKEERARTAPGPARRSSRRVSSSGLASHNRTDTPQRRSTRTMDTSSNYSSMNMLQQHLSNRRNRRTHPLAQPTTHHVSNPATTTTSITLSNVTTPGPPFDNAQSVVGVVVQDTPAGSVVVDDDDIPSIDDVDTRDTPHESYAQHGQNAIAGSSANPFIVNDDPPSAAVTAAEVRIIVAEELRAHGARLLAEIGTLLAAHTTANPQDKGKGRATYISKTNISMMHI